MTTPRFPEDGTCYRTEDPAFFLNTEDPTDPRVRKVKQIYCHGCTVKTACLEYAIETQSDHGIFGGTTGKERHSMRKPKRARFAPVSRKKTSE